MIRIMAIPNDMTGELQFYTDANEVVQIVKAPERDDIEEMEKNELEKWADGPQYERVTPADLISVFSKTARMIKEALDDVKAEEMEEDEDE